MNGPWILHTPIRNYFFLYWLVGHKTYPLRALSFSETIAEVIGHLRIMAAPLREVQPSSSLCSLFEMGRKNPGLDCLHFCASTGIVRACQTYFVEALMIQRLAAEAIGTFWLVFVGCGSALLSAGIPGLGIGVIGIAFAFGVAVVTIVYAFGHISGCHINPAVTVGLMLSKRFPAHEVPGYIAAQVIGGILGAGVLYLICTGRAGFVPGGFASNGYGEHSPGGYSLLAGFCMETIFAFFFLLIILGFAPLAIGLAVALINWAGIPVTNLSLNPARSAATAVFADGWALQQLWLFWVAPILGGAIAGVVYPFLAGNPPSSVKR
jgi:aquaporin Z